MRISASRGLVLLLLAIGVVLAACGLSPDQVQQAAATLGSMPPSELAELSSTIEAMSPEQVAAVATSVAAAGYATLSPADVTAVRSTVEAA
jgi:hypothetical protein